MAWRGMLGRCCSTISSTAQSSAALPEPTLPQLSYPVFHPLDQLLVPLPDFAEVHQLAKACSIYGSAETSPSRTLFQSTLLYKYTTQCVV